MDEQELENMLKPFSQAISTRILRDANGTSRGVGFARYNRLCLFSHMCQDTELKLIGDGPLKKTSS